jgi:hypothetical protein
MDTSNAHSAHDVDIDAANATDADVFHLLSVADADSMMVNASKIATDRPPDSLEGSDEHLIKFDSQFSETSLVIVDVFPFGQPGAPISGMPQEVSLYEQSQAMHSDIWSLFWSQWDWDIVCWAKTHSTTSSAVDNLLGISEVCPFDHVTHYDTNSRL